MDIERIETQFSSYEDYQEKRFLLEQKKRKTHSASGNVELDVAMSKLKQAFFSHLIGEVGPEFKSVFPITSLGKPVVDSFVEGFVTGLKNR